jgi:hypothetical protein
MVVASLVVEFEILLALEDETMAKRSEIDDIENGF